MFAIDSVLGFSTIKTCARVTNTSTKYYLYITDSPLTFVDVKADFSINFSQLTISGTPITDADVRIHQSRGKSKVIIVGDFDGTNKGVAVYNLSNTSRSTTFGFSYETADQILYLLNHQEYFYISLLECLLLYLYL